MALIPKFYKFSLSDLFCGLWPFINDIYTIFRIFEPLLSLVRI